MTDREMLTPGGDNPKQHQRRLMRIEAQRRVKGLLLDLALVDGGYRRDLRRALGLEATPDG